ncbi:hypothetical protein [Paenibacillus gansuensis]|uniref:Uncharacterized protein n=1 Tax=Paenibacillus gansuensis TaxID=306542 RepID=A0ABW5PAS4_9BACL
MRKQDELKIDILESLARSQKALAKIIENMAEQTEHAHGLSENLAENMQALSKYQLSLASKMSGITVHSKRYGLPGRPWLHRRLTVTVRK